MNKYAEIKPGAVFGRLTVVADRPELITRRGSRFECLCRCGKTTIVWEDALRSGNTKSCGCLRRERLGNIARTHGLSEAPEYKPWAFMKVRCLNNKARSFKRYGGRGIKVCDRWVDSFENFLSDMGPRPSSKHSIERLNNDGNYEPGNCKWATQIEQANNTTRSRRISANGKTLTVAQWSRDYNIPYKLVLKRLGLGWELMDALTTAPRIRAKNGEGKNWERRRGEWLKSRVNTRTT